MDEKTIEEAAKVVAGLATSTTVYQDAIQPVAKQIGRSLETLGGVINVALSPVALMVHGYEVIQEKLKQKLEEKLRDVPKEQIVSPPLAIVGPLLEKYRFVHDEPALAELYENLLANAMDEKTVRRSHPAFVHIISQLCPDEAKLLKAVSEHPFVIPKLDIEAHFRPDAPDGPWPEDGVLELMMNLTNLDREANLDPDLTRVFITNLERLGILEVKSGVPKHQDDLYADLMDHPVLKRLREKSRRIFNLRTIKGSISATEFGNMFMQAISREGDNLPGNEENFKD